MTPGPTLIAAVALCGVLILSGCASTEDAFSVMPGEPATPARFEEAIAEAEAARQAAASVGGEWRDTGKIIAKARAEARKGNYETAIELARLAEFQGRKGMEQALEERDSGNPPYLTE